MLVSELKINDEYDTVKPTSTLVEGAKKVLGINRGVLVVVDDKGQLGTLSDSHILMALAKSLDCRNETCESHMNSNILSIKLSDNIKQISEKMKISKPDAVVVVDDSNTFRGYFSPNDYREALLSLSS